jgi:hypothetical protein
MGNLLQTRADEKSITAHFTSTGQRQATLLRRLLGRTRSAEPHAQNQASLFLSRLGWFVFQFLPASPHHAAYLIAGSAQGFLCFFASCS